MQAPLYDELKAYLLELADAGHQVYCSVDGRGGPRPELLEENARERYREFQNRVSAVPKRLRNLLMDRDPTVGEAIFLEHANLSVLDQLDMIDSIMDEVLNSREPFAEDTRAASEGALPLTEIAGSESASQLPEIGPSHSIPATPDMGQSAVSRTDPVIGEPASRASLGQPADAADEEKDAGTRPQIQARLNSRHPIGEKELGEASGAVDHDDASQSFQVEAAMAATLASDSTTHATLAQGKSRRARVSGGLAKITSNTRPVASIMDDGQLAELRQAIGHGHEQVCSAATILIQRAVSVGHLLLRAKQGIAHGDFGPFLKALPFGKSTAHAYMEVAEHFELLPEGGSNFQHAGNFKSLRAALAWVRAQKPRAAAAQGRARTTEATGIPTEGTRAENIESVVAPNAHLEAVSATSLGTPPGNLSGNSKDVDLSRLCSFLDSWKAQTSAISFRISVPVQGLEEGRETLQRSAVLERGSTERLGARFGEGGAHNDSFLQAHVPEDAELEQSESQMAELSAEVLHWKMRAQAAESEVERLKALLGDASAVKQGRKKRRTALQADDCESVVELRAQLAEGEASRSELAKECAAMEEEIGALRMALEGQPEALELVENGKNLRTLLSTAEERIGGLLNGEASLKGHIKRLRRYNHRLETALREAGLPLPQRRSFD